MVETLVSSGVENAVHNCMKIQESERVVIITDRKTDEVAKLFLGATFPLTHGKVEYFTMEDFGIRPITMPDTIMEALQNADVSLYIAKYVDGELPIFRQPIYDFIAQSGHLRHAHMPHLSRQVLEQGMNADYDKVTEITEAYYQRLHNARNIHITTGIGTDLIVEVGKYKWVKCDGIIQPGTFFNLPDGEVFTAPVNASGTIIFDGVFDQHFEEFGILSRYPVSVMIENCVAVEGSVGRASPFNSNSRLLERFNNYLFGSIAPNKNRLGEIAFGTNYAITTFINNMLQDEKAIHTMHFAFGDAIKEDTGSPYSADTHLDCVMTRPTVYVDDELFLKNGIPV